MPAMTVPTTAPTTSAGLVPLPVLRYESCAEAERDGATPLHVGEPGYSTDLDRDEDGVACE